MISCRLSSINPKSSKVQDKALRFSGLISRARHRLLKTSQNDPLHRGLLSRLGPVARSQTQRLFSQDWGLYRAYIGIMEKKMETTIMGYRRYILGLYWGFGKVPLK